MKSCLFLIAICLGNHSLVYALPNVCHVKSCAENKKTELERWECFADHVFGEDSGRFVSQQCDGLGWGNSISSLSITVELAALLNARVMFNPQFRFSRLWTPPREYTLNESFKEEFWTYSFEGFESWLESISKSDSSFERFNHKILKPSICGKDVNLVQRSNCTSVALPMFGQCLQEFGGRLPGTSEQFFELDTLVSLPAFFAAFRRPSPLLAEYIQRIRTRLSLPQLEADTEPHPGSWGLYTPGYYLLAFHFRHIPLGFEPLSVMLNEGHYLEDKSKELQTFWHSARLCAEQARALARCRNESLLIYFATDDAENLRPRAAAELGGYGRVVFGLEEDEVGHMQPHWTADAAKEVEEKKAEVLRQREARARCAAQDGAAAATDAACASAAAGEEQEPATAVYMVSPRRGAAATARHRDMALVEWWILASAQWLATTLHSSYSNTAAWCSIRFLPPHGFDSEQAWLELSWRPMRGGRLARSLCIARPGACRPASGHPTLIERVRARRQPVRSLHWHVHTNGCRPRGRGRAGAGPATRSPAGGGWAQAATWSASRSTAGPSPASTGLPTRAAAPPSARPTRSRPAAARIRSRPSSPGRLRRGEAARLSAAALLSPMPHATCASTFFRCSW